MAASLATRSAWRRARAPRGRLAILGYNYIQSPAVRIIAKLLKSDVIGRLTHFRLEMDEDYMADLEAPFSWRSQASSGYGALDDFAVHPLSLITTLIGAPNEVFGEMSKPYPDRPDGGGRRAVETFDVATALLRMAEGASGRSRSAAAPGAARAAWIAGVRRPGRDRLRPGAFQRGRALCRGRTAGVPGFRQVLMGPAHPPYERFIVAPGHQMGFNDLKVIEAHEFLNRILGRPALVIDFEAGLIIERTIHAIARSSREGRWVAVG